MFIFELFKNFAFIILAVVIFTVQIDKVSLEAQNSDEYQKISFCGDNDQRAIYRKLLYVSTLDGRVTALDITKGGKTHWSIKTGPGTMLSSSIHRLELTNNGQFVRMIPSLKGGLYKFDGEAIDPIPITADNLLSSSFKFSDDLVISGGKETRSYGVSVRTGELLYECSLRGCVNNTHPYGPDNHQSVDNTFGGEHLEHDSLLDDVIVVRRRTQTVRAIEPRSGTERWNFSVGSHEVEVLKSPDCHDRPYSDIDLAILNLDIRVIVPEGIICAVNKQSPNHILWKYQFDHPIVDAWKTDRSDNLMPIDLFKSAEWIWNDGDIQYTFSNEPSVAPSIYLGMFQKQLYIQESLKIQDLVVSNSNHFTHHLVTNHNNLPRIPWKPYPAGSSSIALIKNDKSDDSKVIAVFRESEEVDDATSAIASEEKESTSITAMSVLYGSEYVNGNGFYLYSGGDFNKTQTALCDKTNGTTGNQSFKFDYIGESEPVLMSLWFWWKEIVVISLTTALVLNLLVVPRIRSEREIVVMQVPVAEEATEELPSKIRTTARSLSESNNNGSENFSSRFQNDFELLQCLGKGGFGVVFEAKNKIDDCKYAIKRIILPNKKESRDRVMREVKTLANCEHQNIVRYFQAWVEYPPPGWQESEDEKWKKTVPMSTELGCTTIDIETPDGTNLPRSPSEYVKNISNQYSTSTIFSNGYQMNDDDNCSFIRFCKDSNAASDSELEDDHVASNNLRNSIYSGGFYRQPNHTSNYNTSLESHSSKLPRSTSGFSKKRHHSRHLSLDLTKSKIKMEISKVNRNQNRVYLFIQMQLCRKQSLRDWVRDHPAHSRRPQVKAIFEQIVDAVDYVHLKGLIHRDLKPSNIFFSLGGQIKIGDFGLVTDMSDIPNLIPACGDQTGQPTCIKHTQKVGTHLYMSPEQLQGLPYDFKVDIFSLGLIFFELLVDFGTEMERIKTLTCLRGGIFPNDFQTLYPGEYKLLEVMLSSMPSQRPTTFQIKEWLTDEGFYERNPNLLTTSANTSIRTT